AGGGRIDDRTSRANSGLRRPARGARRSAHDRCRCVQNRERRRREFAPSHLRESPQLRRRGRWREIIVMAKLAAFPKAWLDALCVDGSMTVNEWIELSLAFDIDGLEFYAGFLGLREPGRAAEFRRRVED